MPEQESRLPALSDLIYNTTSPFSTSYYERPVFGGIGAAVDMLSLDSRFDNYPEESSKNLAKQKKAVDKFYQDDKKTPKDVKDLWAEAAVGNVYPDVFYYNNGVQTLPAGSHTVKNKNSYYNFTGYSVPHSTIPLTQKANISSPLEEDA